MISALKTAMICSVLAVGAALIPVQAHAAPNNGDGIVYHRSDCGAYNVRYYYAGGRSSGSSCNRWNLTDEDRVTIWSQDWNWRLVFICDGSTSCGLHVRY